MYLSTSTSTEHFPEMYLSTFQVLYKLYLSTDVLKYKVLLPGSGKYVVNNARIIKTRKLEHILTYVKNAQSFRPVDVSCFSWLLSPIVFF